MKSLRFLPVSLLWSAPNLQVSIFCALVAAVAGVTASKNGRRAATEKAWAKFRNIMVAPVAGPVRGTTVAWFRRLPIEHIRGNFSAGAREKNGI
jgi:hypothetical protein